MPAALKDVNPPANALYRLRTVDRSGSYSYSPIFHGGCSDVTPPFTVYPNPAPTEAVVEVSVRQNSTGILQLVSMTGQLLYNTVWNLQPGINQYVLPLSHLAAGTYVVRLLLNGNTLESKVNKQ